MTAADAPSYYIRVRTYITLFITWVRERGDSNKPTEFQYFPDARLSGTTIETNSLPCGTGTKAKNSGMSPTFPGQLAIMREAPRPSLTSLHNAQTCGSMKLCNTNHNVELAYVVLRNFIELVTFACCMMISMTAMGPCGTRMSYVRL